MPNHPSYPLIDTKHFTPAERSAVRDELKQRLTQKLCIYSDLYRYEDLPNGAGHRWSLVEVDDGTERWSYAGRKYRMCFDIQHRALNMDCCCTTLLANPGPLALFVFVKNTLDFHELGDGSRTESWLWQAGDLASLSEAECSDFAVDRNRVQWFRARADMERWQEEVEILSEEFRRAIRGLRKMGGVWRQLAITSSELGPGFVAFARRQAHNYEERVLRTEERFIRAGGTWPGDGVTLANHVKSERPSRKLDWAAWMAEAQLDEDEQGAVTDAAGVANDDDDDV
ncbi:hypothetical protein Moror_7921 [Moniliophthora roreri MCA 2997]|uniref:Uncharacterized protein n=2 Tax=Moniliophthora roreri TaxID=221103 RepID=V2XB45_MONRO|nr:hypothetical protein Moror_7921 [Moniliophthora roreri MCA 2997]